MISSYEKNNYGEVLYNIVTAFRPANIIELGVLHGYSTLALARGLKRNKEMPGSNARMDSFDLFEDYEFKHGSQVEVQQKIDAAGLTDFVALHKEDAFQVHNHYGDNVVYLLHVDISNTGETLRKIMEAWDLKMVIGGIILFEGGTEERDQEDWMIKYNKPPIKPELDSNPIIEKNYVYGTYLKWPGLTMLLKKR